MEIEMKKENMCKKKEIETTSEKTMRKKKKTEEEKERVFYRTKTKQSFLAFIHNPVKTNKM
jgi:hypothetical protein